MDVLIFELAEQRHGLPVADVQELLPAQAVMPVAGAAPDLEGMINLRGEIVPVLDARKWLGLPAKPLSLADHFIVMRSRNRALALHVDQALELAHLTAGDVAPAEKLGPGHVLPARVAKLAGGMVLLHQAEDFWSGVEGAAVPRQEATP